MMIGLITIVTIIVMTMRFCQHCGHMPIVNIRGIIDLRNKLSPENAVTCDMKTCVARRGSWAPCTV